MADQRNDTSSGPVDFEHHARDDSRMIALLKWGAVSALIVAMLVLLIIAN